MYVDSPIKGKSKDLTNLEMEAMALVNEEVPGPVVSDQQKYDAILGQRKDRKAVSQITFIIVQGENLFNFLERQVGDQMRTALKEPLHNIPENILNRVVSKSIQADLRKYKMGTKVERLAKDRNDINRNINQYGRDTSFDVISSAGDLSKEISSLLGDLSSSCSNKMALIKM